MISNTFYCKDSNNCFIEMSKSNCGNCTRCQNDDWTKGNPERLDKYKPSESLFIDNQENSD